MEGLDPDLREEKWARSTRSTCAHLRVNSNIRPVLDAGPTSVPDSESLSENEKSLQPANASLLSTVKSSSLGVARSTRILLFSVLHGLLRRSDSNAYLRQLPPSPWIVTTA